MCSCAPLQVRPGPTFHPDEALRLVKAMAPASFDETVELQVQLGIDPRKSTQSVRGVAQLPRGSGKTVSIAVFARGEKAEEARRAGATVVGAEDLVEAIAKGELALNFTTIIATPDVMPLVGKVARVRKLVDCIMCRMERDQLSGSESPLTICNAAICAPADFRAAWSHAEPEAWNSYCERTRCRECRAPRPSGVSC